MSLHLVKSAPELGQSEKRDPLDVLYEQHSADVKRWAWRLAGPREDLEDLLHDVFVIALRRRFTFRGEANIKTWLFRITHLVVRNRIRRKLIRSLIFRRHQDELIGVNGSQATPQDEIERRERHVRLYDALNKLPDSYRTTLILYEIEGMSGEEVAELTGVNLGTVWVRLHRGRAKLLSRLREGDMP